MNRHERRAQQAVDRTRKAALTRANDTLRNLVANAHKTFDQELQADLAASPFEPSQIPCKPGCAHCCEMNIFVTFAEASLITLEHPQVVAEVRDELLRQETLARELGITERVLNIFDPGTGDDRQIFNERWWNARVPCAFLGQDKTCRVYRSRPLACRAHLVIDTNPAQCAERTAPGEPEPLVKGFDPAMAYSNALLTLYNGSEKLLGGVALGTLPVMVLAAHEGARKEPW